MTICVCAIKCEMDIKPRTVVLYLNGIRSDDE